MESANIQQEINKYKKFKKVNGATYRKVNQFLRKRTYITAREWALARLCTDFRTSGGAEMTFIGNHLPELVPFMEETYTPQAVNQARNSFKKKVRKSSATFFYGAMCGFFTTDELDDLLFEASEVARFLLEVEGTTLDIDEEIDIEDRITKVMRSVGEAAKTILRTRGDSSETGNTQQDEEENTIRKLPDATETNTPIPKKTRGRKKFCEVSSPNTQPTEPIYDEKTEDLTDITGTIAITEVASTKNIPSLLPNVNSPIDGTIAPPSSIPLRESDEKNIQDVNLNKKEPEITGDYEP